MSCLRSWARSKHITEKHKAALEACCVALDTAHYYEQGLQQLRRGTGYISDCRAYSMEPMPYRADRDSAWMRFTKDRAFHRQWMEPEVELRRLDCLAAMVELSKYFPNTGGK